jgi:ABC-type Fe3+/spermidine/putrescine transport system ATPase subunit
MARLLLTQYEVYFVLVAPMSSITFAAVSKRYDDVDAVRSLDLSCESGEMLALLGPSGCGKSTTLKMAAGVERVTSGEI